jgi:penicillin-binding protein 2
MKRELYMKTMRKQVLLMAAGIGVWLLVVSGRLVYLQVIKHEDWQAQAERQQQRTIRITPLRGTIFDRAGRELAKSVEAQSVFAVPVEIADVETVAAQLAQALGLELDPLRQKLSDRREFVWIKRKVTSGEATAVKALGLPGVHFVTENKRYYPNNELAAHVLGYSGVDEVGLDGVEMLYDKYIRGTEAYVLVHKDARGRSYERTQKPLVKGQDITLTIDSTIQFQTERELNAAVRQRGARSGTAIVMDTSTGEILALANAPTFNPNLFSTFPESQRKNRAIRDMYEPGSVFKVVTYAAALEEKLVRPNETIDCMGGAISLAGHTIRDHKSFGRLTATEALEHSSNIGAIQIGMRVGAERFAEYIKKFGLGQRTGVDLPGEARGLVRTTDRWSQVSVGSISIGQEVGVTAMQMLSAVATVANDGVWVQPHMVRTIHSRAGDVLLESKVEKRRVVSSQTARVLAEMLRGVVLHGTARLAQLNGYSAAGKTGTAQQFDPKLRRYSPTRYVASFAGFAPVKNPRIAVIVALDEPRGEHLGGEVAAPVFKKIAEAALHSLSVAPDEVEAVTQMIAVNTDFASEGTSGMTRKPAIVIEDSDEPLDEPQEKIQISANPTPDLKLEEKSEETAPPEPELDPSQSSVPKVPNFRGLGLRTVARECSRLGVRLVVSGAGRAVRQQPAAGTPITSATTVRVEFQ